MAHQDLQLFLSHCLTSRYCSISSPAAFECWSPTLHGHWSPASQPTYLGLLFWGGSQSLCLTDHTWRVWDCYGPGHHHWSCWAVSSLLPWKAEPRHLGPCLYMVMDGFSPSALTGFCTGSVTLLPVLSKYPQEDRNQGSEISLFVLTPHD